MNNEYIINEAERERDAYLNTRRQFNSPLVALQPNNNRPATQWNKPVPIEELKAEAYQANWIWEGYLAKGQATLFSALWKVGKTTLLCWLLHALQYDSQFANKPLNKTRVLVISEESGSLWVKRREMYDLSEGIWLITRPIIQRLSEVGWSEFINAINTFCVQNKVELVIFDTISTFWSVRDENDASQVTASLLPLNQLLQSNIGLLLVHHERKTGGNQATASRGSGALPSFVDIIVEFNRFDASIIDDKRRVMKTYSRFEESPHELVMELSDNGYITDGTKAEVVKSDKLDLFLELIPWVPQGVTKETLHNLWQDRFGQPPHITTIYRWLQELKKQEKVIITGQSPTRGKSELWGKCDKLQLNPEQNAPQQNNKEAETVVISEPQTDSSNKEINEKEETLRQKLLLLDKNTKEYAELWKQWFDIRELGVKRKIFSSFIPSNSIEKHQNSLVSN